MSHAIQQKPCNVTYWAMLENVNSAETQEELTRIARNCAREKHRVTERQWGEVKRVGEERRRELSR